MRNYLPNFTLLIDFIDVKCPEQWFLYEFASQLTHAHQLACMERRSNDIYIT